MPVRFKRTPRKTAKLFFLQAETERPKADNWQALRGKIGTYSDVKDHQETKNDPLEDQGVKIEDRF
jgi:hypothetical protein